MQRAFFNALLLGELIIIALFVVATDAIVYYVTPTEPPNLDCPGQPCQTMEHYFKNGDRYFNRNKINVTMKFLHGKHTLNTNQYYVEGLNRFEMIGTKPARDIAYISAIVNFTSVAAVCIENLTVIGKPYAMFSVINCDNHTSVGLPFKVSVYMLMNIDTTFFNGMAIYAENYCDTFKIRLENSNLSNGSFFHFFSRVDHNEFIYKREWSILDCTVTSSGMELFYAYATISIVNTTCTDMFKPEASTAFNCIRVTYGEMNIVGNVLFYNTSNGPGSLPFLIPAASNVTISGTITFANNKHTPLTSYSCTITLLGNISFLNNIGTKGGAIALYPSTLNINANTSVYFYNNSATEIGGAIFVTREKYFVESCFYQLLDFNKYNWYSIQLVNNTARNGGDHIYGEFMHSDDCCATPETCHNKPHKIVGTPSYLVQEYFTYDPDITASLSPVSSAATSACLCDNTGQPKCSVMDKVHGYNITVHPGEMFQVPAVVVGADLGTTIGIIHAVFVTPGNTVAVKPARQYAQWIKTNNVCSTLNYTVYSQRKRELFYLAVRDESLKTVEYKFRKAYLQLENVSAHLLYIPPVLNISLLACPPGFVLLGNPPGCECLPILTDRNIDCLFVNESGCHAWNNSIWLTIDGNITIVLTWHCPYDYCITGQRIINLKKHPDAQCSMDRAGRLCGGCKEGYSLAIGSSHCIRCPNNNNLALLIFFAAAGFLLLIFISTLNLTVTQGMINGLTFYANIVWTYQSILFPKHADSNLLFTLLRVFIAWLNLDFGIQMCFVKGLSTFWKTWLQYAFPFYIWSIAGVVICCSRYSTRVTNLLGDKAVSLLATLFLFSYAKLLRTIITSIGFTPLEIFSSNSSYILTVWSLDGRYTYCRFPHIMLFITALAVFVILWLPYTLLLLLMQCLRKISYLKLLRWIPRFKPVYDAYFAPLKDKHHYWFGVLLLGRGILLVVFASTYSVRPNMNYLLLLIMSAVLLCYANYNRVYKTRQVQLAENYFFISLIVIGGSKILNQSTKHAVVYGSIFITLLAFCGVVIWSAVVQIFIKLRSVTVDDKTVSNKRTQKDDSDDALLWDSIFDEAEPLLEVNNTA